MTLTDRQHIALTFLNDGRAATSFRVGEIVIEGMKARGHIRFALGGFMAVGAGVVAQLRRRGLVMYHSGLTAWQITQKGRDVLRANTELPT